ncbi:hypothetical protein VMCG_09243 [Cytospora schulzeri]|uniref:Uncharacterized protein n=1 Tax=Cytospora schulzeri TaxID=448051 RepID=A0A423VKZ5_9PEZI|nr:hypothetical protein VMCG_09243 [Valsa malicola]
MFEGGFSQWGCGTASDLATTVSESAKGVSSEVHLTSVSVSFTQSPSSLATPTQIGSGTPSSDSTASSSRSSSSTTASDTLTTISIPSPTESTDPASTSDSSAPTSTSTGHSAPDTSASGGKTNKHTGAIVGGAIGAVAAVAAIVAAAIFFWRRRAARNTRQGPGPRPGDTHYISPMSGGDGFTPLPGGLLGGGGGGGGDQQSASVRGKTITHITGGPGSRNTVWQDGGIGGQHYPGQNPTAWLVGAGGEGGAGNAAYGGAYASPHDSSGEDEVPLRHSSPEIEDFSRGFHDALSRIGEEDEDELDEVNGNGTMSGTNGGGGSGDLGDSRPLWLQSRRQSRNLMWT